MAKTKSTPKPLECHYKSGGFTVQVNTTTNKVNIVPGEMGLWDVDTVKGLLMQASRAIRPYLATTAAKK